MKLSVWQKVEVEVTTVKLDLPVLFGEEDIPSNFPLRNGARWVAYVEIDTGIIAGWPKGKSCVMELEVDCVGCYTLLGRSGDVVAVLKGYVPHGVLPGDYGGIVELDIDDDGRIVDWPRQPDVSEFFPRDNE